MSQRNQTHSTILEINPDIVRVYSNMYIAVIVLMVMSISTATADRPYSAMLHLKNYQRSAMTTERMSGLALMHVHKDTVLDAERIIHPSSRQKNSHLALLFSP